MRWPWQREVRSYADGLLEAQWLQASEPQSGNASASAALETAAGLYARAFAGAEVQGGEIPPAVLGEIARGLIRRGESVHLIDVDRDGLRLHQAGSFDVRGPARPEGWSYRITLNGPSESPARIVPATSVVHVRYATDPARPWAGLSPLQWASATGRLHAAMEDGQLSAASTPAITLLPLQDTAPDELERVRQGVEDARRKRRRGVVMPVVSATSGASRTAQRPLGDWQPRPIGPHHDQAGVSLRDDTAVAILSACGVPPSLAVSNSDGTAQRESFRRFLHSSVVPLARIVEAELGAKLDAPIRFNFDGLFAADLSGRARAFQSMVGAGMDTAKAAALAGLMEAEQ